MRLTKIYWRKYSKLVIASAGFFAGAVLAFSQQPEPQVIQQVAPQQQEAPDSNQAEVTTPKPNPFEKLSVDPVDIQYSDQWRIVGEMNGRYLIGSNEQTRFIPKQLCSRFVKTGDDYCVIAGKVVTRWTANIVNDLDQPKIQETL